MEHGITALNSFISPLIVASILDFAIGDPWGWPHPVRAMGWAIAQATSFIFRHVRAPAAQRLAGTFLTVCLLAVSAAIGWGSIWVAYSLNYWLGLATESILLASCFAGRSLRDAAIAVLTPLQAGDTERARSVLSLYVGRDTENLEPPEILRAILETVSENSTDGAIAPIFYAILGGAPLALAYKAASTLDSTIGYIEAPYTDLGWFSAKLEDALSWLPCRLTVAIVALLSRHPLKVWRLCCRDAPKDPSPNAGWSECAFAASLGVQMGGINTYRGQIKSKPLLGEPQRPITPEVIVEALSIMQWSILILFVLGCSLKYQLLVISYQLLLFAIR